MKTLWEVVKMKLHIYLLITRNAERQFRSNQNWKALLHNPETKIQKSSKIRAN